MKILMTHQRPPGHQTRPTRPWTPDASDASLGIRPLDASDASDASVRLVSSTQSRRVQTRVRRVWDLHSSGTRRTRQCVGRVGRVSVFVAVFLMRSVRRTRAPCSTVRLTCPTPLGVSKWAKRVQPAFRRPDQIARDPRPAACWRASPLSKESRLSATVDANAPFCRFKHSKESKRYV